MRVEESREMLEECSLGLFKELGLGDSILKSLKKQKFKKPTPIQEKSIPLALAGKDIIAGSETGSGKTLAFGAGIVQNSKSGHGVQALILTPTRELAEQVTQNIKLLAAHERLNVAAVYGGVSINPQIKALSKADIVVGTPGRILDHISRNTIRFSKLKALVLDEADTMLDMGFIRDVEKIISACPKERQTLLFSATLPEEINSLAEKHTREAVRINTKTFVDPGKLTQVYYDVSNDLKFSLLVHLLKFEAANLAMIFCNTRRTTDFVAKNLKHAGIEARAIHGGFTQDKRNKIIKHFYTKAAPILVCTDVAARGLDINGVSHVYNYDIPVDGKVHIHRVGRTARAGKEGKAISIVSKKDRSKFSKILRDNSIEVAREETPQIEFAAVRRN